MSSNDVICFYVTDGSVQAPMVSLSVDESNLIIGSLKNTIIDNWCFNNHNIKNKFINELLKVLKFEIRQPLIKENYKYFRLTYLSNNEPFINGTTIEEIEEFYDDETIKGIIVKTIDKVCTGNYIYGDYNLDLCPDGKKEIAKPIKGLYLFGIDNIFQGSELFGSLPTSSIFVMTFMRLLELKYGKDKSEEYYETKGFEVPIKRMKI